MSGYSPLLPLDPARNPMDMGSWFLDGKCTHQCYAVVFRDRRFAQIRKNVCSRCPVRGECLEYALADPTMVGIWGGLSERDRAAIRNAREEVREALAMTPLAYELEEALS